jgi:hypothetical protein
MNVRMQKERSIDSKGSLKAGALVWPKEKRRSKISAKDLQKLFGEFKTRNSVLLTKYCSHHTEISTKDILTKAKLQATTLAEMKTATRTMRLAVTTTAKMMYMGPK